LESRVSIVFDDDIQGGDHDGDDDVRGGPDGGRNGMSLPRRV
jgi:hypothetical protein